MSHQDWNTITIHSASSTKNIHKDIIAKNTNIDMSIKNKKLENDSENFAHTKIPSELSREITNLRNSMKLTQKDMASKLCIPLATYTDLENRKSIFNQQTKQLIHKIERTNKILFMHK